MRIFPCLAFTVSISPSVWASHPVDIDEISLEDLSTMKFADIATGSNRKVELNAATVTVLSAEDLRRYGIRTIWEALSFVPGITIHTNHQAKQPVLVARGVSPYFSGVQMGILINGVSIESRHSVTSVSVLDLPIDMIEQIEVVRGASSALHGANAMLGAVNIKTKTAAHAHSQIKASAGSYNAYSGYAHGTTHVNDWDVSSSIYGFSSDGYKGLVEFDAASGLDARFGTNTSNAPAHNNNGEKNVTLAISAEDEDTTFNFVARQFSHYETGMGVAQALDPDGLFRFYAGNADLKQEFLVARDWTLTAQVSSSYIEQKVERPIVLYPAGTLGLYPDGILGAPAYKELAWGINAQLDIQSIADHRVRVGIGYTNDDLFYTSDTVNFQPNLAPRGELVDVSDTDAVFVPETLLKYWFGYAQDEWSFAQDWQFVYGLRFDGFSDFDPTLTPRAVLVWATTDRMVNKFIYSQGFRIPTASERLGKSNPVRIGSVDIEPETIENIEWTLNHQPIANFNYALTLYYFTISDYIQYVQVDQTDVRQAKNVGRVQGQGLEVSFNYHQRCVQAEGNWSIQDVRDQNNEYVASNPLHQGFARLGCKLDSLYVGSQAKYENYNHRYFGDVRESPKDNLQFDFIANKDFSSGLQMDFGIYNIFNRKIRHPSPGSSIPNDIPVGERSYRMGFGYRF